MTTQASSPLNAAYEYTFKTERTSFFKELGASEYGRWYFDVGKKKPQYCSCKSFSESDIPGHMMVFEQKAGTDEVSTFFTPGEESVEDIAKAMRSSEEQVIREPFHLN